ncbi:divinyl chlorophyllide a 8-vinyl-reductase, chloroplastic [Tanacetum coccineum]
MFGDGKLCACKPISEPDLASFIADCVLKQDMVNKVLPIGGPGKALTPLEQGEMLFKLAGKKPFFIKVPIEIMDFAIGFLILLESSGVRDFSQKIKASHTCLLKRALIFELCYESVSSTALPMAKGRSGFVYVTNLLGLYAFIQMNFMTDVLAYNMILNDTKNNVLLD